MATLEEKRHTLAHLLAAAVLEQYPDAKRTIGPAIDNGFYFDFEFPTDKPSEESLKKLEAKMRKLLPSWKSMERSELSPEEAKAEYPGNEYKHELIDEFAKDGQTLSFYRSGHYSDLCRGGHAENPAKEIAPDSYMLDRVAGAYWRGDEKNPMLTRIYGLAFDTKEELDAYINNREEAVRRDHRKIGKELDLFAFDEDVGPGLTLWTPNGTVLVEELEKLAKEEEFAAGYARVRTPHVAKESMYVKSGHLPYYEESMYPPMEYEGGKYYLKAMNCPHHHKIYAVRPKSYRDLPVRYAEHGMVYRHEQSGELFGIMRVRALCQNDAHIYCSEEQFADEFRAVNELYLKYFKLFGIQKYVMRLSLHDPKKLGQKYVDEPELWKKTEDMVRKVLIESNIPFVEVADEAAFYGPKIDVQVWSAIGREFSLATNQVDFAVPKRFGLVYTDKTGAEQTPLCIHRAPLGSHERFIGFLIEHYAGVFPLWLSPVQAKILPIAEAHNPYASEVVAALRTAGIRAEIDDANESLGKKIRNAKTSKTPYVLVVGDQEVAAKTVSAESRDHGKLETMNVDAIVERLKKEIADRA